MIAGDEKWRIWRMKVWNMKAAINGDNYKVTGVVVYASVFMIYLLENL